MVMITGLLRDATGQPLTTPLSITLTDYGVATPSTLYLPAKLTVIPDVNGAFSVDLWANQSSAHPCLYRVETPQGSSFLISVPGGELGPLDIGNLVVTKADLKADTNILNRLARLESNGGGTGGGGSILTLGDGLTGGGYDGSQPVTATVSSTIARVNSPTFTSPRSNAPPLGDNSTLLATTSWAGNAANLTQGTLPSARLPSNLAATTAQRLATPRTILGTPFDGTADIPPLTLGLGLVAPNASSLNIDFNVVASASDNRFTNSREWSATTITQLEAEGGADTTRRAWSAQRVRQAITAWWASVESALARLASPAFTGTPTAPTAPNGDASTRLATTAFSSNASNLTTGTVPITRIPTLNQDTTGVSASAAKLTTARSILGFPFDGTADLPLALGNGVVVTEGVLGLDPTDPRLTDAREWTATTITQVESEGGTATTRRAWTSQRVRQAITAWWATLDSTIARLASPSFTGTPLAPTPTAGDSSTQIATTAFASNASNLTLGTIPAARVPTLNQSTTGNSATATRLATGRTIALSGGAVATAVTFDGTTNITLAVSSLDASLLSGMVSDARLSSNIPKMSSGALIPPSAAIQPGTASSLPGALQYRTDLIQQRITPSTGVVYNSTGDLVYSDGVSWRRLGSDISVETPPIVILTGALAASYTANTYTSFGVVNGVGGGWVESVYLLSVYLHYTNISNLNASHFQIQGACIISAIQWKAGGSQTPVIFRMEGHAEGDFNCSALFSTSNTNRGLLLAFDKTLSLPVGSNSYYRVILKRLL